VYAHINEAQPQSMLLVDFVKIVNALGWDRTTLIDWGGGAGMAPPIFEKNYILVLKI
jgi:hypothetical protein